MYCTWKEAMLQEGVHLRPFPVRLEHLKRLTDDTGLLEHCLGKIPRRNEGYSTDDNARALWLCVEWMRYAEHEQATDVMLTLSTLVDTYLSYLLWVQGDDGQFHNNVFYNRAFEPETPSDDCQGRSLWATAYAAIHLRDQDRKMAAMELCYRGFRGVSRLQFPRGRAHALAAASLLLCASGREKEDENWFFDWVKAELPQVARALADSLIHQYRSHQQPGWRWFESSMTYGNGVFPWALFHAYRALGDSSALQVATESLQFLTEKMTAPQGHIRPIGNRGWCSPGTISQWDQQPLEVMKLAAACVEGYRVTSNPHYLQVLENCVTWFHGKNDLGIALADPRDGGCCDGLTEHGANRNQGAESTISYLLTEALYHNVGIKGDDDHDTDGFTNHKVAETRVSRV
jgi:hypothetical protein